MSDSSFASRSELIAWLNSVTAPEAKVSKVEQCCNAVPYLSLLPQLFPTTMHLNALALQKAKVPAKTEYECMHNFKVLQDVFTKNGVHKGLEMERICKGNYQANLEFLQWFKKLCDGKGIVGNEGPLVLSPALNVGSGGGTATGRSGFSGGRTSPLPTSVQISSSRVHSASAKNSTTAATTTSQQQGVRKMSPAAAPTADLSTLDQRQQQQQLSVSTTVGGEDSEGVVALAQEKRHSQVFEELQRHADSHMDPNCKLFVLADRAQGRTATGTSPSRNDEQRITTNPPETVHSGADTTTTTVKSHTVPAPRTSPFTRTKSPMNSIRRSSPRTQQLLVVQPKSSSVKEPLHTNDASPVPKPPTSDSSGGGGGPGSIRRSSTKSVHRAPSTASNNGTQGQSKASDEKGVGGGAHLSNSVLFNEDNSSTSVSLSRQKVLPQTPTAATSVAVKSRLNSKERNPSPSMMMRGGGSSGEAQSSSSVSSHPVRVMTQSAVAKSSTTTGAATRRPSPVSKMPARNSSPRTSNSAQISSNGSAAGAHGQTPSTAAASTTSLALQRQFFYDKLRLIEDIVREVDESKPETSSTRRGGCYVHYTNVADLAEAIRIILYSPDNVV